MKNIIIFVVCIVLTTSLYTSSFWEKQGFNVKDGQFENIYKESLKVSTQCNEVPLNTTAGYNYNGTVMSGYLSVGKGNSVLGFIFYGRQNTARADITKYPILIWLNGGPGSSSQLGNFMQLGPFFIKPAQMAPYQIIKNNHTWARDYNVLFVDQPVGTGISYADQTFKGVYCTSMECVANDFYAALRELYQSSNGCFNRLNIKPDQPLVIFGQSYGGKYAPAIGQKILREQQDNKGFLTGLKGVAIGDGFTSPYDILSQVGEFSFNLGLIDYQQRSMIQQIILNATFQQRRKYWVDLHDSFDLALDLIVQWAGKVNVYDITSYHEYPTGLLVQFFGNPDVISLYNLSNQIKYAAQAGAVYEAMYSDFMMPYVHLVEQILRRKCKFLVYNGQNDLIVQTPGTFKWAERVHYDKAEQFRNTLFSVWKTGNRTSGYKKQAGLYELRTINNAGHLVPMDQGQAARQMCQQFVTRSLLPSEEEVEDIQN